jgi:GT2 family glycosyltransferase
MTDSILPSVSAPAPPPSPVRLADAVTAVVVTRGSTRYLAATLQAVAAQVVGPARVLVVDVAPTSDDDVPLLARGAFAVHGPQGGAEVVPLAAPGSRTFGHAVRHALAQTLPPPGTVARAVAPGTTWLWLLHDDSAPEPTALSELLRAVEHAPSVAVAGVKQRTWTEPARLLEVGLRTSRSGRRMTGVDEAEVDQGQHDGRDDVLAVGIAGALVRRDVWDQLDGPDPALGPFGDGFDLSRRARLAGHRVVVVPSAVVRHAQATYAGLRGAAPSELDDVDADGDGLADSADPRRSFAARRRALLHQRLASAPLPLVPLIALIAVAAGLVRSLVRIATKEPGLAATEITAPLATLARPGAVVRARRRARATRTMPRRALRPLQASWRDVWAQWRDGRLDSAEARRSWRAPSELEIRELAALTTRRRSGLVALAVVLVAVTVLALGDLAGRVARGAVLVGGALVPAAGDLGGLVHSALAGWVPGGLGEPGPPDPFLLALVPGTALVGGSLQTAVSVLLLGCVPLAGLGAWFAAGAATRSVALRLWSAVVWCAAPSLLLALGQGRAGPVLAHVLLPWVALGLAHATGTHRVDSVVSGLLTVRGAEDDDPGTGDSDASDARAEREPVATAADVVDAPDTEPARTADEPAPGRSRDGAHPTRAADLAAAPRSRASDGPGSVAAAAGAAIAFAAVVAGAPSLLVPGVLALLAVAVAAPRGRLRVALVPVPALVLTGPLLAEAAGRGLPGLRLLVADPGQPLASTPLSPLEQLLGVPVAGDPLVPAVLPSALATPWPALVGVAVLVAALLALVRGAPAARAVRLGWLVAVVGLAAAVLVTRVQVAVADGAAVHGWPGSSVSLVLAGLVAAALTGADGLQARLARSTFGWRQPAAVLAVAAVGLAPVLALGTWAWQAREGAALTLDALERPVVPAVGQQAQTSPDASRVLALTRDPAGVVSWQLLRGDGPQLVDLASAVSTRTVDGPLRAPQVTPGDPATAEVEDLVARLASGTSVDVSADLAALAVSDVLVPVAAASADPDASTARSELVGLLDATAGLERITENAAGVIWRVQATAVDPGTAPVTVVTAWARLVDAGVGPAADVAVAADARSVDTQVPAGAAGRLLVLAERSDPGWRATLDGRELRSVSDGWRQTFELGAEGGRLVVRHSAPAHRPWLVAQSVVGVMTVLLALPLRRRKAGRR